VFIPGSAPGSFATGSPAREFLVGLLLVVDTFLTIKISDGWEFGRAVRVT
jgi:hypothetical protein